jgi:hypothetical protein
MRALRNTFTTQEEVRPNGTHHDTYSPTAIQPIGHDHPGQWRRSDAGAAH